jgi:magnesium transporter
VRYFIKSYNAPGSPPGAWDETGEACTVRLVHYSSQTYGVEEAFVPQRCAALRAAGEKVWLDVQGRPDTALLEALRESFGLHHLALEDTTRDGQRAKVEDYEGYLFVVLRRPRWLEERLSIGQTSLFLGPDFVISIDHHPSDSFAPVRERLARSEGGRIRAYGTDYLFYALVDMVIDQGFPILESYAEELEELELAILGNPRQKDLMDRIHGSRRELVFLRRVLWSQREATADLLRKEHQLIGKNTRVYLRDCDDHARHVLDLAENCRDMSNAVLELMLSALNRQLGEVMRVLTMIATIFIPLSFVVGIYGMNFDPAASPWNMPELGWRYGYPAILLVLMSIGGGMILFFRRKGWL